jgi:aldehyde dehydrogenase (NAD+)
MIPTPGALKDMRTFYERGLTRSYAFRVQQLKLLKAAIEHHDAAIQEALYKDLKKSPEEVYASETSIVITQINLALKKLKAWMKPQRAKTDLVNFPSRSLLYKDPRGLVCIISPWNYPFQLLMAPLVGAIAAGNAAVVKPSELAPQTAAIIETILTATFPKEYIQVVQGEGASVVPALLDSVKFDYIFYTGSISVGQRIYIQAAKQLTPVTLELGGKSPAIVEADADLKTSARRIALGKFLNAGQTCVAPDYVLVHESVKEPFLEKLNQTLRDFYGSDPGQSYSYGKIVNEKRFDTLTAYLNQGRIRIGGQTDREALYIAPTVMEDVSLDSSLMTEEIFGPILPVFTYRHQQEALDIIARNPYPLAFYVFTSDTNHATTWIDKVSFGGGCVNNAAWHFANPHLPFGGVGASGLGAYHGKYSFDTFSHVKPVMHTPTWFDPNLKYPPFQGKLTWIRRLM